MNMDQKPMTRVSRIAIAAAVMLGLAGCAASEDVFGKPGAGYVEDMATQVAGADWSKAETITATLSEFEFAPATLSFRQGVPYWLRVENLGHHHGADAQSWLPFMCWPMPA